MTAVVFLETENTKEIPFRSNKMRNHIITEVLKVSNDLPKSIDLLCDNLTATMNTVHSILLQKAELVQLSKKLQALVEPEDEDDDEEQDVPLSDMRSFVMPNFKRNWRACKNLSKRGTLRVLPMIKGHVISTASTVALRRMSRRHIVSESPTLSPIVEVTPDTTPQCRELRIPLQRLDLNTLEGLTVNSSASQPSKPPTSTPNRSSVQKRTKIYRRKQRKLILEVLEECKQLKIPLERLDPNHLPSLTPSDYKRVSNGTTTSSSSAIVSNASRSKQTSTNESPSKRSNGPLNKSPSKQRSTSESPSKRSNGSLSKSPSKRTPNRVSNDVSPRHTPDNVSIESSSKQTPGNVSNESSSKQTPGNVCNGSSSKQTPGNVSNESPSKQTPGNVSNGSSSKQTPGNVSNESSSKQTPGNVSNESPSKQTPDTVSNESPSKQTPNPLTSSNSSSIDHLSKRDSNSDDTPNSQSCLSFSDHSSNSPANLSPTDPSPEVPASKDSWPEFLTRLSNQVLRTSEDVGAGPETGFHRLSLVLETDCLDNVASPAFSPLSTTSVTENDVPSQRVQVSPQLAVRPAPDLSDPLEGPSWLLDVSERKRRSIGKSPSFKFVNTMRARLKAKKKASRSSTAPPRPSSLEAVENVTWVSRSTTCDDRTVSLLEGRGHVSETAESDASCDSVLDGRSTRPKRRAPMTYKEPCLNRKLRRN